MKILIATDSFKGSLSSLEAGNAIADGIRRAGMPAEIQVSPIADGGEGTTEALVNGLSGYLETVTVSDPLGRKQTANYGILPSGTAVMEMAAAAGLPLLSESCTSFRAESPLHHDFWRGRNDRRCHCQGLSKIHHRYWWQCDQ